MSKVPPGQRSKRLFLEQFRGEKPMKAWYMIQVVVDGFWVPMYNCADLKSAIVGITELRAAAKGKIRFIIVIAPTEKEDTQ